MWTWDLGFKRVVVIYKSFSCIWWKNVLWRLRCCSSHPASTFCGFEHLDSSFCLDKPIKCHEQQTAGNVSKYSTASKILAINATISHGSLDQSTIVGCWKQNWKTLSYKQTSKWKKKSLTGNLSWRSIRKLKNNELSGFITCEQAEVGLKVQLPVATELRIILPTFQINNPLLTMYQIKSPFPFQNIINVPKYTMRNKFCSKPFVVIKLIIAFLKNMKLIRGRLIGNGGSTQNHENKRNSNDAQKNACRSNTILRRFLSN